MIPVNADGAAGRDAGTPVQTRAAPAPQFRQPKRMQGDANRREAPTAEEAAAAVAVLVLLEAGQDDGPVRPQPSRWARAGRRTAVRPWPERA